MAKKKEPLDQQKPVRMRKSEVRAVDRELKHVDIGFGPLVRQLLAEWIKGQKDSRRRGSQANDR